VSRSVARSKSAGDSSPRPVTAEDAAADRHTGRPHPFAVNGRRSPARPGRPSRLPQAMTCAKTSFLLVLGVVALSMASLAERMVPEELWELFRRVVPETRVVRPQGGGRRRAGDRECLAAIIFVATSGCSWRQLPPVFGPRWPTIYRRFAQWSKDRVWARLHRVVLDELGAAGDLDWSRCAIDSVSVRALKGGY
jgi:transposase